MRRAIATIIFPRYYDFDGVFTVRVLLSITRSPSFKVFSPSCIIFMPAFDKVSPNMHKITPHFDTFMPTYTKPIATTHHKNKSPLLKRGFLIIYSYLSSLTILSNPGISCGAVDSSANSSSKMSHQLYISKYTRSNSMIP